MLFKQIKFNEKYIKIITTLLKTQHYILDITNKFLLIFGSCKFTTVRRKNLVLRIKAKVFKQFTSDAVSSDVKGYSSSEFAFVVGLVTVTSTQ